MDGWDYVSVSVVCRIYVCIMNDVLSGTTNVTMYLYNRNHKLFTIMGSDPSLYITSSRCVQTTTTLPFTSD